MSRTLTAADRSALIRLASTMEKGSPERKAILAGLNKSAQPDVEYYITPKRGTMTGREFGDILGEYARDTLDPKVFGSEAFLRHIEWNESHTIDPHLNMLVSGHLTDDEFTGLFMDATGFFYTGPESYIKYAKKLMTYPGMPPLEVYKAVGRYRPRITRLYPPMKEVPSGEEYKIRRGRVTVSVGPERVYVMGATFNIKDDLKSMMFRWDRDRKAWYMPTRYYNERVKSKLQSL